MKNLIKLINQNKYNECLPEILNISVDDLSPINLSQFAHAFLNIRNFNKAYECFAKKELVGKLSKKEIINYGIAAFRCNELEKCVEILQGVMDNAYLQSVSNYHIGESYYYLADDIKAENYFEKISKEDDLNIYYYSAIYLIILKYLKEDYEELGPIFLELIDINKKLNTDDNKNFTTYLKLVAELVKNMDLNYEVNKKKSSKRTYVIGDSHSLAMNGIEYNNSTIESLWCMGIKSHHLSFKNRQSIRVNKIIEKIRDSRIFFYIGEIDLRNDEGILRYSKANNKSEKDVCRETVNKYVKYIHSLNNKNGNDFGIITVPCTIKAIHESRKYLFDMYNEFIIEESKKYSIKVIDFAEWCYGKKNLHDQFIDEVHRSRSTYRDFFYSSTISKPKREMSTIKINDKDYDTDTLNAGAKAQLDMLLSTEAEIRRLQTQLLIAQTAKKAYAQALADAVMFAAPTNNKIQT